ncbi:MAG: sialidase family protein [Bradymonadaceae bacterium]
MPHVSRLPLVAALLVFGTCTSCESDTAGRGDDPPASSQSHASSRHPTDDDSPPRGAPLEWSEPIQVDSGPAETGPWRMNDSRFHYVDDPAADFADGASLGVVWVDNQRQQVLFQSFDRAGEPRLASPTTVSASPETFSWLPDVAVDGDEIYVLWQEIVFSGGTHGGEAFFARSTDGGRSFTEPTNLSRSQAGDGKGRLTAEHWDNGSLDLAVGPDGTLYTAWTEYEGRLWFRRSTDGGKTFEDPIHIFGGDDRPARGPDFAVEPDGTLHLAWTVGGSDSADIHLATSTNRGETFEKPTIAFDTEGHSDAPSLAADPDGYLHLVWGESPGGRFGAYHVRYARNATAPDAEMATVAGPDTPGHVSAHYPAIAIGGSGAIYLVWERYATRNEPARGLGFAVSGGGDGEFSAPSMVPGTADLSLGVNGSLQGQLMQKIVADPGGKRIAVVNSRFEPGERSVVRLMFASPLQE